jgi:hypothetical protein
MSTVMTVEQLCSQGRFNDTRKYDQWLIDKYAYARYYCLEDLPIDLPLGVPHPGRLCTAFRTVMDAVDRKTRLRNMKEIESLLYKLHSRLIDPEDKKRLLIEHPMCRGEIRAMPSTPRVLDPSIPPRTVGHCYWNTLPRELKLRILWQTFSEESNRFDDLQRADNRWARADRARRTLFRLSRVSTGRISDKR